MSRFSGNSDFESHSCDIENLKILLDKINESKTSKNGFAEFQTFLTTPINCKDRMQTYESLWLYAEEECPAGSQEYQIAQKIRSVYTWLKYKAEKS